MTPAAKAEPEAGSALSLPGDAMGRDADGQPVLYGGACDACGAAHFPTAAVCPACGAEAVRRQAMSATGTVYSWTNVHTAPKRWARPFTVAYVDLDNGVRLFTRLSGTPAIGARVALSVAIVGQEPDGRPIESFIFQPAEA